MIRSAEARALGLQAGPAAEPAAAGDQEHPRGQRDGDDAAHRAAHAKDAVACAAGDVDDGVGAA